jgi:hypothetical protein
MRGIYRSLASVYSHGANSFKPMYQIPNLDLQNPLSKFVIHYNTISHQPPESKNNRQGIYNNIKKYSKKNNNNTVNQTKETDQ